MNETNSPYDRSYALSRSNPPENWLFNSLLEFVDPKPAWRVLDVGCNTGELTWRLKQAGCVSLGIDINTDAIALARSRFPDCTFQEGEVAAMNETEFDAAVASHIIEHLSEPGKFLVQLRDRLKDGGKLVLATPNRGAYIHRFCHFLRGIPIFHDPTHHKLYTASELRSLLRDAGFRDIRTTTRELYVPLITHLPRPVRNRIPGFGMGDHLFAVARR